MMAEWFKITDYFLKPLKNIEERVSVGHEI